MKIFVDIDGVLADMHRPLLADLGFYCLNGKVHWAKLHFSFPNFFLGVLKMGDADILMDYLAPFEPQILTAEPNTWKWPNCADQKRTWIKKEFGDHLETIVVPHAIHKQEYCLGSSYVLIDDSPLNIEQWKAKGGIGILHTSSIDTIHQLQDLGISLTAFIPQEY